MVSSLLLLAVAAPQLLVDAGVYPAPGAEVFVGSFSIDARSTPWPDGQGFGVDGCELPSPDEWLAASNLQQFDLGSSYELVATPWSENCRMSQKELEGIAEVEGAVFNTQYYATGLFPDAGDETPVAKKIIAGEGQDSNSGDPSPRTYRCVKRQPTPSRRRFVAASGINLRAGRGPEFPILDGTDIGHPVDELYSAAGWSFVTAKLSRNDCDYAARGWVKTDFLGDTRPDRALLLATGKTQLAAGQFAVAAVQLERAYAFDRGDLATRELLLRAYDGAGMKAEADKVRAEAKKAARHKRKK